MVLKPAWDGFAALGNNGLVALSRTSAETSETSCSKSKLFNVHGPVPTDCRDLASFSDAEPDVDVVDDVPIPMHTRYRTRVQTMKKLSNYKKVQAKQTKELEETSRETASSRRSTRRERKIKLEQHIEKLKKKLRYEENVHRALERAFTRPLGALPRLPPYLSPKTLELLAEVAVLEEEVVRLEEQIVNLRQGLYQEAVYISSSRKQIEPDHESAEQSKAKKAELLWPPSWGHRSVDERQQGKRDRDILGGGMLPFINEISSDEVPQTGTSVHRRKASLGSVSEPKGTHCVVQVENFKHPFYKGFAEEGSKALKSLNKSLGPLEASHGKENQQHMTPTNIVSSSQVSRLRIAVQKQYPVDSKAVKTHAPRTQTEHITISCNWRPEHVPSLGDLQDVKNMNPNKLSEEMVKCLLSIFLKLTRQSIGSEYETSPIVSRSTLSTLCSKSLSSGSTLTCKMPMDSSEEIVFRDPYGVCSDSGLRDVGPYKHLHDIAASSIDLSRIQNASSLLKRLKVLVHKLSCVDLKGLTHQQKLAFWLNIYNVCMMNAYVEHGIQANPQMVIALMRKAVLNVGGHLVNALTIEHFILRLPYHSKDAYPKGGKKDKEATMRSVYGLEWPEPLVTFALSCGSRSSPAVRVYTGGEVENELEAAKKEYLQAAIGVTSKKKLLLPKLLDWYLRDFAKDAESLIDWILLQLPMSLRHAVIECLEKGRKEMVSEVIDVMPYEFDFRYLFAT